MSVFLEIDPTNWVAENELAFAIRDGFPVSPGHTLVIPKRVILDWFEASKEEQVAIFELVDRVKASLDLELNPAGYNIGMNCGEVAGQTVMHLHVHVIPRFSGDMPDPRGGVRHVIPWKGNYKTQRAAPLAQGGDDPFLKHLNPLFATATQIDILAAFVQDSGISLIESRLISAVERGARVRVLCSDYLHITQESAVRRLFDLQSSFDGMIRARVARRWATSFHPKSWQFLTPNGGAIFVGSSNLSWAALNDGIEWNLRLDHHQDPEAFALVREAFEKTWAGAEELTQSFVESYREAVRNASQELPIAEIEPPRPTAPPTPHSVQVRVLAALQQARDEGHRRALAVMATGLGKTWLAAFDVQQFSPEKMPRVLFVAHRAEILNQAANTFRALYPDALFSWFVGTESSLAGDVVFASIQKIARLESLMDIEAQGFDYVIIDEVHHAAASSYQRILENLDPGFLLGLTATPDRSDGQDIQGLFNDYIVDDVGILEGIEVGRLVPFKYVGIADTVDFAPIPWRGRFDIETLSQAVQTNERMEELWRVISANPNQRTIAFCCTIQHAIFVRDWLSARGLRAAAVVSNGEGDDRESSLRELAAGDLDVVCAVDILNEGVDIPAVDRVFFLRPTESKVVFLQQLGRGLRVSPGKSHLDVIDFVGNHKIFSERMRWLLSMGDPPLELTAFLKTGNVDLPAGCSVDLEFDAKDLLRQLIESRDKSQIVAAAYREHKEIYGARPTAAEFFRLGHKFSTLKSRGGWTGLVQDEGDSQFSDAEFAVLAPAFEEIEKASMTKSFKMICLMALIEEDALFTGLSFELLARRSLAIIRRSPELLEDIRGVKMLGDLEKLDFETWLNYWKKNPIAAWGESNLVSVDKGHFRFDWPSDISRSAIKTLTRELVEYRLATYRARLRKTFYARVTHNATNPILMVPNMDGGPTGEVIVQLEEGVQWVFRFAKIAVNVAHPLGDTRNRLPDLLRAWFGKSAGESGTRQKVRFEMSNGQWFARPVGGVPPDLKPASHELLGEMAIYADAFKEASGFHQRIVTAMVECGKHTEEEIRAYLSLTRSSCSEIIR